MVQIKKGILTELHTQKSDQFQVKLAVILTNKQNQETHKTKQNKPQNKIMNEHGENQHMNNKQHMTQKKKKKQSAENIIASSVSQHESNANHFIGSSFEKKKTEFRKSPQYCINQNSIE